MSPAWPAPAKLNLFLHVTGRRPDGYHELQTAFQLLDYCDEILVEPRSDRLILRPQGAAGVPPEADLAVRAARRLQAAAACPQGADIRINKRIPLGGGLGGGSSDAATTLVALNRVWGLGWSEERLAALGLELGADVPLFVRGRTAWAEGVGEELTPLALPSAWYLVVCPSCAVSTAQVFADPELTRDTPKTTIKGFVSAGGRNDCEPVVRRLYPEVGAALDWLAPRARDGARLTGTGGCVFARFPSAAEAEAVLAAMPARWTGFVARGVGESALLGRCRAA